MITGWGNSQLIKINFHFFLFYSFFRPSFFHSPLLTTQLWQVGSTVPYNALQCNTEHYVTEWKYGQRWSDQVSKWEKNVFDLVIFKMFFINLKLKDITGFILTF